jgi:hypothetical protein
MKAEALSDIDYVMVPKRSGSPDSKLMGLGSQASCASLAGAQRCKTVKSLIFVEIIKAWPSF